MCEAVRNLRLIKILSPLLLPISVHAFLAELALVAFSALETQLGFSPEGKGGAEFNLLIGKATLEVQAGGETRKIVREKLSESLTDFIKLSSYPLGSEGLGPLLHLKAVIYYPNGEGWYGLHPAVAAILETAKR